MTIRKQRQIEAGGALAHDLTAVITGRLAVDHGVKVVGDLAPVNAGSQAGGVVICYKTVAIRASARKRIHGNTSGKTGRDQKRGSSLAARHSSNSGEVKLDCREALAGTLVASHLPLLCSQPMSTNASTKKTRSPPASPRKTDIVSPGEIADAVAPGIRQVHDPCR